mmetsp:Transcript_2747/g.4313  ORF Transcript_2747/g.4313 Transcript_2747/m.4313 type:complete len:204 (+) Transcript_2747:1346-1957(+)
MFLLGCSPLLFLQQCLVQEVELLLVDHFRLGQLRLIYCVGGKTLFELGVRLGMGLHKLVPVHLEGLAQLYSYFLLLLEYKFVVLHVFLSVRLEVGSQLVQVQAVFVRAPLPVQEELTEFRSAERSADQSIIINELVDGQDGYCAVSRVRERHIGRVRRAPSASVVDVVCVYYYLFDVAILPEELEAPQDGFRRDIRGEADDID